MRVIVTAATIVLLLASPASARANGGGYTTPPTVTPSTGSGTPEVTVYGPGNTTLASYRPAGRRNGGGPAWTCRYYEANIGLGNGLGGVAPNTEKPLPNLEEGNAYYLQCTDAEGRVTYGQAILWNPAQPLGQIAAAERAAEIAYQSIPLPDPVVHTSPPENTDLLVGLDSWAWIDDTWTPATASASIAAVTATVTATPATLTIDWGDGSSPTTCTGPGTSYRSGATSDCTHTFLVRSTQIHPDGRFTVSATVTYDVTFTATNGQTGTLPGVTRTGAIAVRVLEAQAVIR